MDVRRSKLSLVVLVASVAVVSATLTGCTETIAGTPGPPPTVASGDFPSGTGSADDEPTDTDTPSDEPTADSTPSEEPSEGSVEQLCADMSDSVSGPDIGADAYQALIYLNILAWGLGNGDTDPFSTVDAVTTATCPDVRTAVLAKTGTPDLATVGD